MNLSTLYTLLVLVVPFVAALAVYGTLRTRDRSAIGAGCAAVAVGLFASFAITTLFILLAIT